MKIRKEEMKVSALSLAVRGALVAMFVMPAMAQAVESWEDEVAFIRHPTNYIEIGAENVSKDSAKFGEYNGLDKSGGKVIGNASVRGGDAYNGEDGIRRWSVFARDLGTKSREVGASVGDQGKWNFGIGYDELRHGITDTYQTPLQGSMGGNVFTLPANFGVINAAINPSARTLNATQLGAFHTEDVGSTRKNTSLTAGINLSPQLTLKFDYNHLAQSGAKLMAGAAAGGVNTGVAGTANTWRAEAVAILMNPTNYKTDTFNLALNWKGEQGHLSGSYFGSIFKDGYDRLSYQNPMTNSATVATVPGVYQDISLGTAPDNQLHQLNLTGGYVLTPTTKLAGGVSWGRNTQNAAFLTGMPEIVSAPDTSLNGLVVTKHADLKLTNQATRELALSATVKYNERDNRSSSKLYQYRAINSLATTNAVDAAANAPYSNKKTEFGVAGDYRLDKNQAVRLAYDLEKVSRWCNSYGIVASNCLVSTSNTENKLGVKYKLKASDDVNLNAGYTRAKRTATFDHNAITPLAGLDTLTPGDVNAQDFPGFAAYTYAARTQDLLKAGVNWQASEKLALAIEGRYVKDKYDSTLGVQGNRSTGLNLDSTYSYSEDASVSAYASVRNGKKDMRIGAAPPAATGAVGNNAGTSYAALVAPSAVWTNELAENSSSAGVNTKHRLMGSKLELVGDLSYTLDKSRYTTAIPYTLAAGAVCSAPATLTCGELPTVRNRVVSLKLVGIYALDKTSKVSVGYMFQQLKSDDYFYNTYQYGYTPFRVMPTNQQPGSYAVNVVSASYIYNFK